MDEVATQYDVGEPPTGTQGIEEKAENIDKGVRRTENLDKQWRYKNEEDAQANAELAVDAFALLFQNGPAVLVLGRRVFKFGMQFELDKERKPDLHHRSGHVGGSLVLPVPPDVHSEEYEAEK